MPAVTEADVANEFIAEYPDEDLSITTMFGRLAYGTASAMLAERDEDFEWIRNDPIGGTAYRAAAWQFLAVLWENITGQECKLDVQAEKDPIIELSVVFANITFETYSNMSGGKYKIAQMKETADEEETDIIMEKTAKLYHAYFKPQFQLIKTN